jgi:hypothetical protein
METSRPEAPTPPEESKPTTRLDRPMELNGPAGLPYTDYFPGDDGQVRGADLEHPAPVPRVGEIIEYIDERGQSERFVVREVVHTLQTSAASRPSVDSEPYAATAIARDSGQPAEIPGGGGELRAGLPKVFVERVKEDD